MTNSELSNCAPGFFDNRIIGAECEGDRYSTYSTFTNPRPRLQVTMQLASSASSSSSSSSAAASSSGLETLVKSFDHVYDAVAYAHALWNTRGTKAFIATIKSLSSQISMEQRVEKALAAASESTTKGTLADPEIDVCKAHSINQGEDITAQFFKPTKVLTKKSNLPSSIISLHPGIVKIWKFDHGELPPPGLLYAHRSKQRYRMLVNKLSYECSTVCAFTVTHVSEWLW